MHDSKANAKRWNITYTQYSALEMPADLREKYREFFTGCDASDSFRSIG